ncbi:MAG TPA: hypothetical protein VGX91_00195 [Candidatus Cybelea sp.]|jgi:hypothetical protein|nr:hypothetical protein [Candidatus Cybelea sp.]
MARIEGAFDQMNLRMSGVERRLDSFEQSVGARFDSMDRHFSWVVGLIVGGWATMTAAQITTILTIVSRH